MIARCLNRLVPALLLAASFATGAAQGPGGAPSSVRLVNLAGQPVDPFADVTAKVIVFLFVRADCPISNRYAPEVRRLSQKFASPSVAFDLVYVDPSEPVEEIREHMRDYGYRMPALRDNEHALVKMTGAQVTPEAAVFVPGQSGARMVYRGRIDDQYVDFGKTRPAPTTHDLENVLEAIAQGGTVATQTTRAVGCFIQDLK
jgi:thiol-disulfide isomerase/thioredoxin